MSAAKDNTTTISQDTSKEINQEKIGIDDSSLNKEILKTNNENTTLKEPVSGGTFNDIQTAINNATSGSIIELSGLYIGNGTQITINKKLTIIGTDDATLDAQGKSKIFYFNADYITLKNIKFINGNSETGGAISASPSIYYNSISNCTFINNIATRNGGAIGNFGRNSIITNCTFINNVATGPYSGAIYIDAMTNIEISNSTFTNNKASNGGAIFIYGSKDSIINECNFTSNTASSDGGAIYWESGENCKIKQCTFIKNTGGNGGAIYWKNPKTTNQILNSNFKDNKAKNFKNINTNNNNLILSNCSLETDVSIDQIADCINGSSATVKFTFDDGTNLGGYNVILKNNNQTIKTFTYNSNHIYTYTWNNLAVGEYSITVNESNENNNKYITSYEPVHFTVYKKAITPNDINVMINPGKGNATINIYAPTDLTNTISIIIDGKNYTIAVTEGTGTKTITLTPGKHNLTGINITNDPIYDDVFILKTDENFTVNKIDINPNDINIKINPTKGNATINITTPKNFTGTMNVIIDEKSYNIPVADGTGTKTIALTPGKHNLTGINITNDPIYEDVFILKTDGNFTVNKIDINPNDINIKINPAKGNATININAPTDLTNTINIIIDGKNYTITVTEGTGTKTIILTPGKHNLTGINITNDPIYNDVFILKTDGNFTVNKIDIGPGDVNITVTPDKGNATINIKAPTEFTGNIIIIIDNVSYPVELVNGVGFKIIILPSGYHNITGVNITNNTIYNDTFIPENIPFVVLKKDTIITARDISFIINYGGRYTVSTNLGSGKTITLIINNQNINAITDANGVATFKLTKANLTPAGVKTATIIFNGDDNYTSYTINTKITVNKETTKITGKSAKKTYKKTANKKIRITLKDSTGKSLGKVKIHLKAKKLKGKLGKKLKKGYYITVKFNKKGIGYITLKNNKVNGFKKGTYKFTITYKGNNIYKPSKSKIKMKIK